jgi:signal transduction histidine kinase
VDNLLDNAIRHSRPGDPIRVGATVSGDTATVTVENSGPGFPDDILAEAFEPFVRGEPRHDAPDAGGAGLGLAIVRAVAEAHGGTATAQSVPDGARVTMTMALGAGPAEGGSAASR